MLKLVSLFTGAGGLDLGFKQAGYQTVWANEFDKAIWVTITANFKNIHLDKRDITTINPDEIPDTDGIIGGPPCQSWSEAGAQRGINDARGQLFYDYIRILKRKQPLFFLAENVSGILHPRHQEAFKHIINTLQNAGYTISWQLLNAVDYGVPQDRLRVFMIGYRADLQLKFQFPAPETAFSLFPSPVLDSQRTLAEALHDLPEAIPAQAKNKANVRLQVANHEYFTGDYSTLYMSRNRVRGWHEPSYTIQASGRHAPLHPQAPKMLKQGQGYQFAHKYRNKYRRLTVRECARIQTFPDDFIFHYQAVNDGYKMVGNAVPVVLAQRLATAIKQQLLTINPKHQNVNQKALTSI